MDAPSHCSPGKCHSEKHNTNDRQFSGGFIMGDGTPPRHRGGKTEQSPSMSRWFQAVSMVSFAIQLPGNCRLRNISPNLISFPDSGLLQKRATHIQWGTLPWSGEKGQEPERVAAVESLKTL